MQKITRPNEVKLFSTLEIKTLNQTGKFTGYASVFNIEDNQKDIILPNAFKKTLEERSSKNVIKLLWQHDAKEPIGYFDLIKEDKIGLYVEGQILLNLEKGREVYALIKKGVVSGLSIGYNVKKSFFNKKNKTRIILEIDLWEISIVTFPANEHSVITNCKSYFENREVELFAKNINKIIAVLSS